MPSAAWLFQSENVGCVSSRLCPVHGFLHVGILLKMGFFVALFGVCLTLIYLYYAFSLLV